MRLGGGERCETKPIVAKLEPTAKLVGRYLDAGGQPVSNAELLVFFNRKAHDGVTGAYHFNVRYKTDSEGRFQIDDLVAGLQYQILTVQEAGTYISNGFLSKTKEANYLLKSGETLDIGDVTEHKIGN